MQSRHFLPLAFIWSAILALCVGAVLLQRMRGFDEAAIASDEGGLIEERGGVDGDGADAVAPADTDVPPLDLQDELVGKIVYGLRTLVPTMPPDDLMGNAEPLGEGDAQRRLAYAALVARVRGWEAGLDEAQLIEVDDSELHADELRAARTDLISACTIRREASAREDSELTEAERAALDGIAARLEPMLGFFARIATGDPTAEAIRTLVVLGVVGGWYVVVFIVGLGTLILLGVLAASRRIAPRFEVATDARPAVVLGETFLLWMVLFMLLQVAAGVAASVVPPLGSSIGALAMSLFAMFASLAALAYPAMRGVPFAEVRRLVGLHRGAGFLRESMHGVACYVGSVPLLAIGLVVFAVLTAIVEAIFGSTPPPAHPATDMLGGASALQMVLLFALASVAAPIVEEISFRGLLYGHLRGVVAPRVRFGSMLVAALASSFVFAVIHPQGVLFVPALGGLATGFCISRELRGSLIAPMVAHAINNAVTMSFGLMLFNS